MNATPSLPPSRGFVSAIRKSSHDLRVSSGISIRPESIERLFSSPYFTSSFERLSKNHGLNLPLKFASYLDELNFLSVLSLLNFASGYRVPLHAQTGRGAWDSIRALTFALYIGSSSDGDYLSAKGMRALTVGKIAELMGINLHVERPHERIPGVMVGELGGPLYELVRLIKQVLNETGEILERSGYMNLGAFVAEALQEAGKILDKSDDAAVEVILERLASAFPAFRDMSQVNGQLPAAVYCFKKALFLIHAISIRFGSLSPSPFPIPNTSKIPVFSDNVLPSLLIHLGVIELPAESPLSKLFPETKSAAKLEELLAPAPQTAAAEHKQNSNHIKEGARVTADQSYILRAAAIDACELIIDIAQALDVTSLDRNPAWLSKLTLPNLDMWIWSAAKDRADYRALGRFVDQNTVFF